jgi:hypothetical protein
VLTDTRSSGTDRHARKDVNTSAFCERAVIRVRLLTCRIGRAFSRPPSVLCGSARLGAQSLVRTVRPVSASRADPRLLQAQSCALAGFGRPVRACCRYALSSVRAAGVPLCSANIVTPPVGPSRIATIIRQNG